MALADIGGWGYPLDAAAGLTPAYRRLGELYEAKNDRVDALRAYGKFVDLWKNADAGLQPQVADVRRRIERLQREESARR